MEIYDSPIFNLTILNITCKLCNKPYAIEVNKDDFIDYNNGKLIQNCFPYLTAGEHELLIERISERLIESKKLNGITMVNQSPNNNQLIYSIQELFY